MKYGEILSLFGESGLSPENLAFWIGVSNSTYRRWQKAPSKAQLPAQYEQNVSAGIYKLLSEGKLRYESRAVGDFVERHLPVFFRAAISQFEAPDELLAMDAIHQDKITALLAHLGNNRRTRKRVDQARKKILKFSEWGSAWRYRISTLCKVLTDKELTLVDRLISYGALFYLILPFDLIPDAIPVFGYVDDFGILGFATAHYAQRYQRFSE